MHRFDSVGTRSVHLLLKRCVCGMLLFLVVLFVFAGQIDKDGALFILCLVRVHLFPYATLCWALSATKTLCRVIGFATGLLALLLCRLLLWHYYLLSHKCPVPTVGKEIPERLTCSNTWCRVNLIAPLSLVVESQVSFLPLHLHKQLWSWLWVMLDIFLL